MLPRIVIIMMIIMVGVVFRACKSHQNFVDKFHCGHTGDARRNPKRRVFLKRLRDFTLRRFSWSCDLFVYHRISQFILICWDASQFSKDLIKCYNLLICMYVIDMMAMSYLLVLFVQSIDAMSVLLLRPGWWLFVIGYYSLVNQKACLCEIKYVWNKDIYRVGLSYA